LKKRNEKKGKGSRSTAMVRCKKGRVGRQPSVGNGAGNHLGEGERKAGGGGTESAASVGKKRLKAETAGGKRG